MDRILIVDGSNLLFQMFYGMPARILSPQGKPIQGTLGFVGALLKMLRLCKPTHVAVLFDGENENPRKALDEAYKANREDFSHLPEEDTPFSQLPDIYAALDILQICHAETRDCETDDWIAGYASNLPETAELVIASMDSDFFQLIRDRIFVLRYRGDRSQLWDRAYLREKLDVMPEQYAYYKSLTGDSADNIPGIPGVGPKTAAKLVRQFPQLEDLLAGTEHITRPALRQAVQDHLSRLAVNHALICLKGTQELPFPLPEMTWDDPGFSTVQVLQMLGLR